MLRKSDVATPDYIAGIMQAFEAGRQEEYIRIMSILEDLQRRSSLVLVETVIENYKADREMDNGTA